MKYDTGEGTPYGRNYLARMEDIVVIDHRQKRTPICIDTVLPPIKVPPGIYWSSEFGFVKQLLDPPEELEIQWDGTYKAECCRCGKSCTVDNPEELQNLDSYEFYCGGSPSCCP